MEIANRSILVLGGWGLVGMAVVQRLLEEKPRKLIISSLREEEVKEAKEILSPMFPEVDIATVWGNIFVRSSLRDLSRNVLLGKGVNRRQFISDIMEKLDDNIIKSSFLYQIIMEHRPHIIVDAVNTVTAISYGDIYDRYFNLKGAFELSSRDGGSIKDIHMEIEKLVANLYIPQIIRHIELLYIGMVDAGTKVYIKIGTTGTGGMGFNIPYTHSEERPSRVLLSKSCLAGAHSLLLFLMGRTPGGPIVKEIKPATAVAWKSIEHGTIKKQNRPIHLFDCPLESGTKLGDTFQFDGNGDWLDLEQDMESVYINTGENGIFSRAEFETLTTIGQMEFVTPEEIASNVIMEILGNNTGHDIINALDNSIMGPSYRAGYMRESAIRQMEFLMKEYETESVAFELLGPPRLSKLLHEANLIKRVCGTIKRVITTSVEELAQKMGQTIRDDIELRSQIISIGIPILLGDGKTLLRGPVVAIPVARGREEIPASEENLNRWAYEGWVDLREQNIALWQKRFLQIVGLADGIPQDDTSSRYHFGREYWAVDSTINIGKLVAWIFMNEEKGMRVKE